MVGKFITGVAVVSTLPVLAGLGGTLYLMRRFNAARPLQVVAVPLMAVLGIALYRMQRSEAPSFLTVDP